LGKFTTAKRGREGTGEVFRREKKRAPSFPKEESMSTPFDGIRRKRRTGKKERLSRLPEVQGVPSILKEEKKRDSFSFSGDPRFRAGIAEKELQ